MAWRQVPPALIIALVFRSLGLLLPHTYFQPDEFYQALEPAHHAVFGYGYLTWEWKDLPSSGGSGMWEEVVVKGRMRSWLWPSVFVGVYRLLQRFGLDEGRLLAFAPRTVGVLVAAFTDWQTYRLANRVLGQGASAGALFLSMTSLFHAHLLPRALSTSPETLLTTLALTYFPLPRPVTQKPLLGSKQKTMVLTKSGIVNQDKEKEAENQVPKKASQSGTPPLIIPSTLEEAQEINYVALDRMGLGVEPPEVVVDDLILATVFATVAICIRPTTIPFWGYMGAELLTRTYTQRGVSDIFSIGTQALATALAVVACSTAFDYHMTGRLYFPILTFIHQNIILDISSFYGSTNYLYHLTQSLPIMLFPIWYWWAQGFFACLLPSQFLTKRLADLDRPEGLRVLARGITFAVAIASLSPHSEWRFLHPFLPPLLLFALPPLFRAATPTFFGCYRFWHSLRQYTRLPKRAYYFILLAPVAPYLYLNIFHGWAQVEVMNRLRSGEVGIVTGLAVLGPCHSTPWQSTLHRNISAWFLTCEPPLGIKRRDHETLQDRFFEAPTAFLSETLTDGGPSHIVLFGSLLEVGPRKNTVRDELNSRRYHQVWRGWNGLDIVQSGDGPKGGVEIWARSPERGQHFFP